jgi:hypothetical protein
MKKLFTLSALATLGLGSLSAQAQFTVNGVLASTEVGTGPGKYQLLGSYAGTHSVSDRGLKAIYMGTTATTLNIMVVGSPEQTAYSALVLYLDAPNRTGIAAGTRLPGSSNTSSQLRHRPTLDMPVDYGFRITVSPLNDANNAMYLSRVSYTTPGTTYPEVGMGSGPKNGVAVTDATDPAAARTAFSTTASVAANSTTGWEFEISTPTCCPRWPAKPPTSAPTPISRSSPARRTLATKWAPACWPAAPPPPTPWA